MFLKVQQQILDLVALCQQVENFNVPENLQQQIKEAAVAYLEGDEKSASDKAESAHQGIKNVLCAFLRNSVRYFKGQYADMLQRYYEQDIVFFVGEALDQYVEWHQDQPRFEIGSAVEKYSKMLAVIDAADDEQQRRCDQRKAQQQAEEAERKAQKEKEREEAARRRRAEEVTPLLNLFAGSQEAKKSAAA